MGDLAAKLEIQTEKLEQLNKEFEENGLQFEDIQSKLRLKLENE